MKKQTKDELIRMGLIIGVPVVAGIVKAFDPKMVGLSSPIGGPLWLFTVLTGLVFGVCGYCVYKVCADFVKNKLLRKK